MVLALTLLLAATQSTAAPAPITRPAMISGEMHAICDLVEQATVAGDFAKAERLMGLFPKENVTFQWDDSKVPEDLRDGYARARDRAFQMWQSRFQHIRLTQGDKPDIKFTFEPVLATSTDSKSPQTLALMFSRDPSTTRLEAVIGVKRGNPLVQSNEVDVHNEVMYAIGSYLGLGTGPAFGSAMGRTEQSTQYWTELVARESIAALQVNELGKRYRESIAEKKAVKTAPPQFFTDTNKIELGTVIQGGIVPATLQFTNSGSGLMSYSMTPDCGCMRVSPSGLLKPGESTLVRADFDSTQFIGELNKQVFIQTNDPEKPLIRIPVHVFVQPNYRFLRPEGQVIVLNGKSGQTDVYLTFPDGSNIVPTEYIVDGIKAAATAEDWKGTLADPELNEGPKERAGFKVKIVFDGISSLGRSPATLVVKTSNPKFETIRYTFYLQRGIVALPLNVYMGTMGTSPKTTSFIVSRPGKPFKVKEISSDSPNLAFSFVPNKTKDEYTVTVAYNGRATTGDFKQEITIKTDDGAQPVIKVPVTGIVG